MGSVFAISCLFLFHPFSSFHFNFLPQVRCGKDIHLSQHVVGLIPNTRYTTTLVMSALTPIRATRARVGRLAALTDRHCHSRNGRKSPVCGWRGRPITTGDMAKGGFQITALLPT